MNNQLIKTNNVLYNIIHFFKKLFYKHPMKSEETVNTNSTQKEHFFEMISVQDYIDIKNRKTTLADKLRTGEIGTSDLTEKETLEMIDYFNEDINKLTLELKKIKKHILEMKANQ